MKKETLYILLAVIFVFLVIGSIVVYMEIKRKTVPSELLGQRSDTGGLGNIAGAIAGIFGGAKAKIAGAVTKK